MGKSCGDRLSAWILNLETISKFRFAASFLNFAMCKTRPITHTLFQQHSPSQAEMIALEEGQFSLNHSSPDVGPCVAWCT